MEGHRFDTLTRVLSSRRTALGGIVGSLAVLLGLAPKPAEAHNPLPRCRKIKDPAARRRCQRRARRHNRQAHACKSEPIAVTCVDGRCGRRLNNCRRLVTCPCPSGRTCLSNRSCAQSCDIANPSCPAGCVCFFDVDNRTFCAALATCVQVPQLCGSTAQCPPGHHCEPLLCDGSPSNRCVPLC